MFTAAMRHGSEFAPDGPRNLADALDVLATSGLRKQYDALQRVQQNRADSQRRCRIVRANIVSDGRNILRRLRREPEFH